MLTGGKRASLEPLDPAKYADRPTVKHPCPSQEKWASSRLKGREATQAEKRKAVANLSLKGSSIGGQADQMIGQLLRNTTAQLSFTRAQAIAKRRNVTRMSHDSSHGTQVSYVTSDGKTFLWYPGNRVVLSGRWQACESRFGHLSQKGSEQVVITYGVVCFKYGANTRNPVTGVRGAKWQCAPAGALEQTQVEERSGDIFGLSKRTQVPFVLPKKRTTLNALAARLAKQSPPNRNSRD